MRKCTRKRLTAQAAKETMNQPFMLLHTFILARSPVSFVDTHYARFVNRMQRGQLILKLGLAWDVAQTEPLLFRPLMVEAREPGAGEIREMFSSRSRKYTTREIAHRN